MADNPNQPFECLHTVDYLSHRVNFVVISPDGQTLVIDDSHWDTSIRLLNLPTRKLRGILKGHLSEVNAVAISSDGQTIASASNDRTIKIWNLHPVLNGYTQELRMTLTGHLGEVKSVAISPDGQTLVSGSWDTTIKLWNLYTGEYISALVGHLRTVNCVAISPDGQTLVSGGDGEIKVWGVR
jgi:WD40 repeat protein